MEYKTCYITYVTLHYKNYPLNIRGKSQKIKFEFFNIGFH